MSFSEMAFLDGSPRSADCVAMPCVGCRVIQRTFFDKMGTQFPALKAKLLHEIVIQTCDRLRQANMEISTLRS